MIYDLKAEEDPMEVPAEWWSERMRFRRNRLLVASDWTQTADAPVDKQAWATYRQQLRDAPADPDWPNVVVPNPPA